MSHHEPIAYAIMAVTASYVVYRAHETWKWITKIGRDSRARTEKARAEYLETLAAKRRGEVPLDQVGHDR